MTNEEIEKLINDKAEENNAYGYPNFNGEKHTAFNDGFISAAKYLINNPSLFGLIDKKDALYWIKASEKLPDDYKPLELLNILYTNHKGLKIPFIGTYNSRKGIFYLDGLDPRGKEEFHLIEWLSSSPIENKK